MPLARKSVYLFVILLAVYISIMIHCQPAQLKGLGYNQLLDLYAPRMALWAPMEILYDPAIDKGQQPFIREKIKVALPGCSDYRGVLEEVLQQGYSALVECSALDRWHTTDEGLAYLYRMKGQSCRVVVFDGGHHLPTLGLEPDILIIPRLRGYTCHSYMRDGMKIKKLLDLAREARIPTVIAVVPRWSLVKHQGGLEVLTGRIMKETSVVPGRAGEEALAGADRMSRYRGLTFAYVTSEDLDNIDGFTTRLASLGGECKKIYLAIDYQNSNYDTAAQWAAQVEDMTNCPVEIVNEPITALNVFWSD